MSEKKLAILGFGNQAKAWSLNLRDSGWKVNLYLRPNSPSFNLARTLGFNAYDLESEQLKQEQNLALLIPDHLQADALKSLQSMLKPKTRLIYAHGYSMGKHGLNEKYPHFAHLLMAPKSIASEMRFAYETGKKLSGVYSVEFSPEKTNDETWLKELGVALGIKVGPFATSFKHECQADLLSEQGLLCGLYPYAMLEAYNLLRAKGISSELAFLECWHESKLIMDAMVERGPKAFFSLISPNALYGSQKGQKLLRPMLKKIFSDLYQDIEDETFNQELDQFSPAQMKSDVEKAWDLEELEQTYQKLKELYT